MHGPQPPRGHPSLARTIDEQRNQSCWNKDFTLLVLAVKVTLVVVVTVGLPFRLLVGLLALPGTRSPLVASVNFSAPLRNYAAVIVVVVDIIVIAIVIVDDDSSRGLIAVCAAIASAPRIRLFFWNVVTIWAAAGRGLFPYAPSLLISPCFTTRCSVSRQAVLRLPQFQRYMVEVAYTIRPWAMTITAFRLRARIDYGIPSLGVVDSPHRRSRRTGESEEGTPERLRAVEIELDWPPVVVDDELNEQRTAGERGVFEAQQRSAVGRDVNIFEDGERGMRKTCRHIAGLQMWYAAIKRRKGALVRASARIVTGRNGSLLK